MTTSEILARFAELNVLVIGDLCLDRWCVYDPDAAEPSRETGIHRTGVVSVERTPGAAGTVASNLIALGARHVSIMSAIGEDGFGWELRRCLGALDITAELSVRSPKIQTFTYTKLLNKKTGEEDLPRVDFINMTPLPEDIEQTLVEHLQQYGPKFDVIIVSDQAETNEGGVVTARIRDVISDLAGRENGPVVWVDSRMRPELYRHAIVKPNDDEAAAACRRQFGSVNYSELRRHIQAPFLVITRGPEGALIVDKQGERLVPTRGVGKPVDICGAGDSFSAGGALTYSVTRSPDEAARIGNMVASVTIMKKGTGTASPAEVLEAERR